MTLEEFNGSRGQAIAYVARNYESMTGRMLSRTVLDDIGFYIDKGIEPELMIKAIDVTLCKGADWRYTRAILQRCFEEEVFTVRAWDFQVLYKKGIAEAKKNSPTIIYDDTLLSMYLAVTVFKEYIEDTQKDLERYLEAVKNSNTSEWDARWSKYQRI